MIYPHTIRLAGPWEFAVLRADSGALAESTSGRAQLPLECGALLGEGFRGQVCFRRRFNRPTNLDPQEAVWLVIEGRDSRGQVGLNGEPVGNLRGDAVLADFDVTSQLKIHNNLSIDIEHTGSIAGVRLEIRRRLPVKTSAD